MKIKNKKSFIGNERKFDVNNIKNIDFRNIFNHFQKIYLIIILSSLWNYNSKGEVEKFPISIDKITTLLRPGDKRIKIK